MEQIGVITEVKENMARVQFKRASACGENCGMCGGCEKLNAFVDAKNEISAVVGDTVKIETDTSYVLLGAFFVYIVPVILGIIGYFVLGFLGAVTGFAIPFIIIKAINSRLEKYFRPRIIKKF